jgi:hypothetical protein
MSSDRVDDVALTEAAFRIANERVTRCESGTPKHLRSCTCANARSIRVTNGLREP